MVGRKNTLAHECLDLESRYFEVAKEAYDTLDDILNTAKKYVDLDNEPEEILSSIGKVVKNFFDEYDKDYHLFSTSLEAGTYVCRSLSLIYYSIGEFLNLPISAIFVPNHMFVRWNFEDGSYFNWETTSSTKYSDEKYIKEHRISNKSIKEGIYLRNLERNEILSEFIRCGSFLQNDLNNLDGRIECYTKAAELDPNDHNIDYLKYLIVKKINLLYDSGVEMYETGNLEGAADCFEELINFNSGLPEAYYNLACVKEDQCDFEFAIVYYEQAIRLDPDYDKAKDDLSTLKNKISHHVKTQSDSCDFDWGDFSI